MMTYFKEIATGFWSLLAGMAVTIRYFVKPVITVQYPRQKIQMSPRYRGYPQFILDPDTQTHRCIACEMCSRICPSQLITVEGAKFPGEKQKRGEFHDRPRSAGARPAAGTLRGPRVA